jgi:hypothetical protein
MSTAKDISKLVKKIRLSDRPSCTWVEKDEVIKIIMDHFNIPRETNSFSFR